MINELKLLVANGHTDQAIERLMNHFKDQGGALFNQIILISARYKEVKQKSIALGGIDDQAFNNINQSLLGFLEEWQAERQLFEKQAAPLSFSIPEDPDKKALAQTYTDHGELCLTQFEMELAREAFLTALSYVPDYKSAKFGLEIVEFWTPVTPALLVTNDMLQMRLEVLLQRAPNNIHLLLMKSTLEWEANEQDNAIRILEAIIKKSPNTAAALLQLGYYWHSRSDLDQATDYYKKALEANPKYALAHINLGYVYRIRRDFTSAVFHLDKAARQTYNLLALIILGDCYRYQGDFANALYIHQNAENFITTQSEVPPRFYLSEWLLNYMPLINQEEIINQHVYAHMPQEKQAFLYFSLALDMVFSGDEAKADLYFEKVKTLNPQKFYFKYFSNQLESSFEELKVTKDSPTFVWLQKIHQILNEE
jgi:tetratricopeptide (TPR) repeat protein